MLPIGVTELRRPWARRASGPTHPQRGDAAMLEGVVEVANHLVVIIGPILFLIVIRESEPVGEAA